MMNKSNSSRDTMLVTGALIVLLATSSVLFFKQQINGSAQETTLSTKESSASVEPNTAPRERSSFILSTARADRLLQQNIDQAINSSDLASARWGVFVMSLRDGRVLYARDADLPFTPASNLKLYTTAVALDVLGTDYRWRTSVYADAPPDKDGMIEGDLTLYGRGAPDLVIGKNGRESSLGHLAGELYKLGVRRVRGDVIGDESYFNGEPLGDGWLWNDVQWYYGAEVSAMSIGGNEISLTIVPAAKPDEPARVKLEPETTYVQVKNDAVTVTPDKPSTIGINRGLSDNKFRVWGDFPSKIKGFNARLAVHQPALWAANLLSEQLRNRGIIIDGDVRFTDASNAKRESAGFDPQGKVELAHITSKTLGEVSRAINKESLNLESELVLRTLGKEKGATAREPDPPKGPTRSDAQSGVAVIRQWLENAGISTHGTSIHDGSGLSRLNLVTPEGTVRLLVAMSKSHVADVFRNSLPIAGRDGTLGHRLRPATGRIFAKTGTLTYINSLSGYVINAEKETLAFSIICNNDTVPSSSTPIVDAIAMLLAANPTSGH